MAYAAGKLNMGTNVDAEVSKDGILTMKIDLKKTFGPSKSGKTTIIASTNGNAAVDGGDGAIIGLNVYRK